MTDNPERVLHIDVTDDTRLAAAIAALDEPDRDRLATALRTYADSENDRKILDAITVTLDAEAATNGDLAVHANPAVGVLFESMEWDNGYFLSDTGTVLMHDGTTHHVDFDINHLLTDAFGTIGADGTLAVDLRTRTLEFDDYGTNSTIHEHFGISKPHPTYRPDNSGTLAWWRDHGGLPDDLTIDGRVFPDASHAIGYLILKRMSPVHVLYLARSNAQRLAERQDKTYLRVAAAATEPEWVTTMAARVAFTNAWIEHDEYTRLTS